MTPTLYYCYDAYCGWCYGFSPVIRRLWEKWHDQVAFEVLSGGLILPENPVHISASAAYIRKAYPGVEELTGVRFGADYLWHIEHPEESDWYPDSLKPAVAMCILKEMHPDLAVPFAADLQHALHAEGRDLCDDEAYRHLLSRYEMPKDEFYAKLHSTEYQEKARYDFALCKQLQVTGYPAVLAQVSEQKFYLLAKGFTPYADLEERLEKVLASSQPLQQDL